MKKAILLISSAILLCCCKKTGPEGPQGASGPAGASVGTGIITGRVFQYSCYEDSTGTNRKYTTDLDRVLVSIDGTTLTTMTDAAGNYTLNNLPQSVYDISFIKEGTGLYKAQQIICPGKGVIYKDAAVYDTSTTIFNAGYLRDSTDIVMVLRLYYNPTQVQKAIVFYSITDNIDPRNPDSYSEPNYIYFGQNNSTSVVRFLKYPESIKQKYPGGTVFYARVYTISTVTFGYYDYLKDKGVYTTFGSSLPMTFSLTLPL